MDDVAMPWDEPALTRAGRIKIGRLGNPRKSKSGSTWQPPVKLDRILITYDHRGPDGNFEVNVPVMAALGAPTSDTAITEIPIEVHSDEITDVLACKLVRYVGRKNLACTGDGKTARERDGDGWRERECPCPRSTLINEGGDCKPNAVFSCSLALEGHRVLGAVYEFRTTSAISIRRLTGSLRAIKSAVGGLRGLPLILALREVELAGKSPVWCMHVELREVDVAEAQRMALRQASARRALATGEPPAYLALPPGDDREPVEETEAVVAEFYPDEGAPVQVLRDPCPACERTQGHQPGCPEAPIEETNDQ